MTTKRVCIVSPKTYGYGALLIAGILENKNREVTVSRQFSVHKCSDRSILGISLHSISDALEYSGAIREIRDRTGAYVVVGGSASIVPEIVLHCIPWADLVVVGEGEETIVEVIKNLENEQDLDEVKGVAFKKDEVLMKTGPRKPVTLEGRPRIKIPNDLPRQSVRGSNIYLETHRGCIGKCTFCLVPRMFGNSIRSRPLEEILDEGKALKENGVSRVAISGGTASLYGYDSEGVNEKAFATLLHKLCQIFGKSNLTAADLRVDMITPNVLESLDRFTRGHVAFGIESGSEKILQSLCKDFGIAQVCEAVRMSKKAGLQVTGSFMTGFPFEEESDYKATRDLVRSLELYDYAINIVEPIPGTPLFRQMVQIDRERNPLFQPMERDQETNAILTVAEYRALNLWVDAYETKHKKKCPKSIFRGLLQRVKQEGSRIAKLIELYSVLE